MPIFRLSRFSPAAAVAALGFVLFLAGCPDESAAEDAETAATLAETTAPLLAAYLEIQTTLAADGTDGVAAAAGRIAEAADALPRAAGLDDTHRGVVGELAERMAAQARALAGADDLAAAREAFKPLSESVLQIRPFMDAGDEVVAVHCPMKEARWLQRGRDVKNPYHGSEMLGCGRVLDHDEGHADQGHHDGHDPHAGHDHHDH